MEKLLFRVFSYCCLLIVVGFCHNTVVKPGSCIIRYRVLEEGDTFEPQRCHINVCRNSTLSSYNMDPEDCPKLPCDLDETVFMRDRCCEVCPGTKARCRFNGMTVEDGATFQLHPCGHCDCHDSRLTCNRNCTVSEKLRESS